MNLPATSKAKLDRMQQIVSEMRYTGRDVGMLRELTDLAFHFQGMMVRRRRLEQYLDHLGSLRQNAAIERQWEMIHEVVGDFSSEISDASSEGASGGIG